MNKILLKISILTSLLLTFSFIKGQNNKINLTLRDNINLDLSNIAIAGGHHEYIIDESQWLNYSVKIGQNETYKSVYVAIGSGSIPTGTEVYLQASDEIGNGWGNPGIPTGKIKLSTIPTLLVSNIGNCNTGNGKLKGHKITLTYQVSNFAILEPSVQNLYLIYTLQ